MKSIARGEGVSAFFTRETSMSLLVAAPLGSPLSDVLPPLVDASSPPPVALPPLTSPPAPSTQKSAPAPPPPSPLSASAPSPSASLPSPDSLSSPAPPPPPSPSTARSPPPPPSSKTTHSPPPPPKENVSPPPPSNLSPPPPAILSPSRPSSKTTNSPSPPPPPPPTHVISSPPPPSPPASRTSSSTTPPSSSSATAPPPLSSSSLTTISGGSLVAIGVSGILAISVLAVLFYCLCKKKKKYYYNGAPPVYKDSYYLRQQQEWCSPASDVLIKIPPLPGSQSNGYDPIPSPPRGGGSPGIGNSKSWFTYQELAKATDGFAKSNELGEGGFGCVYKGTLTSGQLVAVKQLKAGASQGEKEFRAEVEIISRVHHRHLVSLVGYCIADRQRLLVYDYVPNGTLEWHLHKRSEGPALDWPTRLRIACGAARGLAYLHEDCHPRIIHRDIKSSNILLDDNFEAQVSDFGLAKLTSDTNTHVTTRVMGTFGYLAPEYASSGKLTDRSDVFSFGVVLLELLTGRKPVDPSQPAGEESLVEWARPVLAQVSSEEDLREIADPSLNGAYDVKEMMRMMEAAAACVRHSASKRPRMGQVVRALEDESSLSDLNKGFKPGHSGVFGSFASSDYESGGSYTADMRKYMRVALDTTQEFGSECSGATSEYGLNASVSSGEYKMSREMDENFSQQHPLPIREMDENFSQQRPLPSREMEQNFSQRHSMLSRDMDQNFSQQRPMSMIMRNNVHLYDTQQFRLGN